MRDGQDPDEEEAAQTADWTTHTHDVEIIFGFRKLQILEIDAWLNGIYPDFFNFSCLQILTLHSCGMKWDLTMLAGLPVLKELDCDYHVNNMSHCVTGNIKDLRVLKETLEKILIQHCENVEGNFMDLADFPHLKCLCLDETAVSGDIRDIGEHDFVALEEGELSLPENGYGCHEFMFPAVSDVRDFFQRLDARVIRLLPWYYRCYISEESDDWYPGFPFYAEIVRVGPRSRLGWMWKGGPYNNCEVNWIDPEPESDSSGYEEYIEAYNTIHQYDLLVDNRYRGFLDPPTEEEYVSLSHAHLW